MIIVGDQIDTDVFHQCRDYKAISYFFFFNDTATTEIYTLSLHDALPISFGESSSAIAASGAAPSAFSAAMYRSRSEEHTSELQSPCNLVCRLLLEKKKKAIRDPPAEAALLVEQMDWVVDEQSVMCDYVHS